MGILQGMRIHNGLQHCEHQQPGVPEDQLQGRLVGPAGQAQLQSNRTTT